MLLNDMTASEQAQKLSTVNESRCLCRSSRRQGSTWKDQLNAGEVLHLELRHQTRLGSMTFQINKYPSISNFLNTRSHSKSLKTGRGTKEFRTQHTLQEMRVTARATRPVLSAAMPTPRAGEMHATKQCLCKCEKRCIKKRVLSL